MAKGLWLICTSSIRIGYAECRGESGAGVSNNKRSDSIMENTAYRTRIEQYLIYLKQSERSASTIRQYCRDILAFFEFLDCRVLTKEMVLSYKVVLEQQYSAASVNTKLSALNSFFSFIDRHDLQSKLLKIQQSVYCPVEKELDKEEYVRLVKAAEKRKNERLALLLQTICGTGIRVSELRYITAEAVRRGETLIRLKGKTRAVLIPQKLQKRLKAYICREGITTGPVFVTRSGRPLDRSNIWKMMKALCQEAGVDEKKVFPHNLRHLFARCFYSVDKDIAKLADILGHSSINTTRIYIITSGIEHRRRLDALGLVV